jgi:hypothetical protein
MSIIPEILNRYKFCPECKQFLPLDKFRKRSKYPECIRCIDNKRQREYRERIRADPERNEEYKARDRETHKQGYVRRKDEILARRRQVRKENIERYLQYERDAYKRKRERNPDKMREKGRLASRYYRNLDREKYRARERVENMTPEAVARKRERERLYRQQNPHKNAVKNERRRVRLAGVSGSYTEQDIREIYELQYGRCLYCGFELNGSYTVDHFIPLSQQGCNSKDNLALACLKCNSSKRDLAAYNWDKWNGATPVFWRGKLL